MSPEDALIACRMLQDGSSVLLWGAYAYLSTLVPSVLAETMGRQLKAVRLAAIAIAVGTTCAALPLEASVLGNGWGNAGNLTTIHDILLETSTGHAWLVQVIAIVALLMTVWLVPHRRQAATALGAALLLGSRALTGHGVMREGAVGALLQTNYLVHVLSAGAWLGALVPILLLLRQLSQQNLARGAALGLRRFSTAGHVMVALAVCSGVINTGLILRSLPLAWSHPYQLLLALKICIVGGMIVIALINRYVIVPRMGSNFRPTSHLLLYTTAIELMLGCGALVLVNLLSASDPS
jgi:putative copper resistance protein D